ncbi:SPX domain-containing protein [Mucor velutinosus]|uniref:SPX domain-containing protein n=1 Tax=Mucor velutinosus TaxID=708070 RepID=A0AAN7D329_9FUNG|nr:SPX domain-containing protein [Mucor velutinosus]
MDTAFNPAIFLNDNQAAMLQLQDLFGQDELDLGGGGGGGGDPSLYYDELTFVSDHTSTMVDTIEPSHLISQNYVDNIMNTIVTEAPLSKRRRSSTCSSSSSLSSYSSSSSSSEEEGDEETFSSLASRRSSLSSDSEEEQEEIITPFMHRRQMEEMILDKITNQLDAEKLPGILTIISKQQQEEEEEVEIDLARLDRDQLTRILSYIDACLKEKQGGPKVKLSNYTLKPNPIASTLPTEKAQPPLPKKQPHTKNRSKNNRNRRKSIIETGHTVRGSSHSQLSASHGPISMSALTEMEASSKKKQANSNKRKRRAAKKRKSEDDLTVQMSSKDCAFNDSIASTKPKRKSAVHKRKLLEEMLQPSSDSEDDQLDGDADGGSGIIIFGNEQMDLAVTHNETIVHRERRLSIIQRSNSVAAFKAVEQNSHIVNNLVEDDDDDDDDDDELIDIMM